MTADIVDCDFDTRHTTRHCRPTITGRVERLRPNTVCTHECMDYNWTVYSQVAHSGASIPPEAMVRSPQDGRMGPPNF